MMGKKRNKRERERTPSSSDDEDMIGAGGYGVVHVLRSDPKTALKTIPLFEYAAKARRWHPNQNNIREVLLTRLMRFDDGGGIEYAGCRLEHTPPGSPRLAVNAHMEMECAETDLSAWSIGNRFVDRMALLPKILTDLLWALHALHHVNGVAHGDLKPSNVLLVRRGGELTAVLADFGSSSLLDAEFDPRGCTYVCCPPEAFALTSAEMIEKHGRREMRKMPMMCGMPRRRLRNFNGAAWDAWGLAGIVYFVIHKAYIGDLATSRNWDDAYRMHRDGNVARFVESLDDLAPKGVDAAVWSTMLELLRASPKERLTATDILTRRGEILPTLRRRSPIFASPDSDDGKVIADIALDRYGEDHPFVNRLVNCAMNLSAWIRGPGGKCTPNAALVLAECIVVNRMDDETFDDACGRMTDVLAAIRSLNAEDSPFFRGCESPISRIAA